MAVARRRFKDDVTPGDEQHQQLDRPELAPPDRGQPFAKGRRRGLLAPRRSGHGRPPRGGCPGPFHRPRCGRLIQPREAEYMIASVLLATPSLLKMLVRWPSTVRELTAN